MKKIICIAVSLMLFMSLNVSATEISASAVYNSILNGYVITGFTDDTVFGDEVTVEAYLDDKIFDVFQTETVFENDKPVFKTDCIMLDALKKSGKVSFKIHSAHCTNTVTTDEFDYYGVDILYPLLKTTLEKLSGNDFDGFLDVISDNSEKFNVDIKTAMAVGENGKKVMEKYIKGRTFLLPDDINTTENSKKVFDTLIQFRTEFKLMTMLGEAESISSSDDITAWYSKYSDILELDKYENSDMFLSNYTQSICAQILRGAKTMISDTDVFKARLIEAGVLTKIYMGRASDVKQIFEKFADMLKPVYASSLSEIQKVSVYTSLAGQKYFTYDDASKAYDVFAAAILMPPSSNQGGGSGGSSGSSGGSIAVSPSTKKEESTEKKTVFEDLQNTQWAEEAIEYLYDKKIVSGKNEKQFAPNDNITRAEFIKLVVSLKKLDLSAKSHFSDVDENDWFAPYVNVAYEADITKGYNDGSFKPQDKITRQDMAVLLYRIINSDKKTVVLYFTDKDSISDYAVTAVGYLYDNNIIKGMQDGSFAPHDFATRAQAAQMIYNIVKAGTFF